MPTESAPSGTSLRFVVVTFVAAGIVGALVLYLGLTGQLGGPIP